VTYLAGLAIDSDVSKNVDPLFFGVLLLVTNTVIVVLACWMGLTRLVREEYKDRRRAEWRKLLTSQEVRLVGKVMGERPSDSGDSVELSDGFPAAGPGSKMGNSERAWKVLRQILLKPSDVIIEGHLGTGAFGDGTRTAVVPVLLLSLWRLCCCGFVQLSLFGVLACVIHTPGICFLLGPGMPLCSLKLLCSVQGQMPGPGGGGEEDEDDQRGEPADVPRRGLAPRDPAPPQHRRLCRGLLVSGTPARGRTPHCRW
jgi:hypothetical protein